MKKRLFVLLSFVALALPTTGCKSMFPTDDTRTKNTWQNFDEAQTAYDRIIPHKTTVADLKEMGFDCHKTANIRILTYLDLIQRFIPNSSINKDDLQEDVRRCLEAKDCCQAYELNLDVTNRKRYGSLFLDLFGFKRVTKVTGWNFQALVIIKDDVVTYKLRSGQPVVDRVEKRMKPLGPFQDLEGMASRMPGMM